MTFTHFLISLLLVIISLERNPPIEEVIQSGVVPLFVEFLSRDDYPQLQVCVKLGTPYSMYALVFLVIYRFEAFVL